MPLQSTLPNLLTFCAAYELGSFSEAARRLTMASYKQSAG